MAQATRLMFGEWGARDFAALAVAALAVAAVLGNVLWLQSGTHPAPLFNRATSAATSPPTVAASPPPAVPPPPVMTTARARPAEPISPPTPAAITMPERAAPAVTRAPGEIIHDIQRELARRGYYDGTVDGMYGAKTDAAIRAFESAAGLKPSSEPSEALLQAITRAPAKLAKSAGPVAVAPRLAAAPVRNEGTERPAPARRVVALQRALADYGYGQIKPTGTVDPETQAAIERFERERKLPVTGQPSERVTRELSAMTGRSLE
ncbi:MAG: peptidoglycan-binding protein [Xanthobacteraceae bacterium]